MSPRGPPRVRRLMVAGWLDSPWLSFAWTLPLLEVVERYGLRFAGQAGAAMLTGTALSAPVPSQPSVWLGRRQLLCTADATATVLWMSAFGVLSRDVSMWPLAVCRAALNVTAWTGYAGLRAEVAAIARVPRRSPGTGPALRPSRRWVRPQPCGCRRRQWTAPPHLLGIVGV